MTEVVKRSAKMRIDLVFSVLDGMTTGKVQRSTLSRWVMRTTKSVAEAGFSFLSFVLTAWYAKACELRGSCGVVRRTSCCHQDFGIRALGRDRVGSVDLARCRWHCQPHGAAWS